MSDTWQGPGWRRADDGKWYPEAELAPPPPAPPVPPAPSASPPPPGSPPFAPPGGYPPPGAPQQPLPPPPPPPPPPTPTPGPAMAAPGAPAPQAYPPPPAQYPQTPPPGGPGGPGAPGTSYGWAPMAPIRPVSTSLAGWVQGLFWAVAAMSVVVALASLNARNTFDDFMDMGTGPSITRYNSWVDADNLLGLVSLLEVPLRLALAVVLIVWTWKCHKAASGLNPGPRRWGSGWAVGAWFIPLASLVLPKLVIDETEKIAVAPRAGGTAVDWKGMKVSRLGIAWWWLFVLSSILNARAAFTETTIGDLPDPDTIPGYYVIITVAALLAAVSAVCGALFSKDLSRRLSSASLHGADATGYRTGSTVAGAPASSVDQWAARTSHATSFCSICREPLFDDMARCPRCGKRRQPAPT